MTMIVRHQAAACLIAALLASVAPVAAHADHQPLLLVDGETGAPIEVREGDWGLRRPGAPPRNVYPIAPPHELPPAPGYLPSAGAPPKVGRLERKRPARRRAAPRPDTSFYRSWSATSAPTPVDPQPRGELPPITYAPSYGQPYQDMPGATQRGYPAVPRR